jgi:hypothetical protein
MRLIAATMRMGRRGKHQLGQAMVLMGLMLVVLIGVIGLAVDGAVAYAYSVSIERAAAAAALAGVPYMPNNFNTPAGGPNAITRATEEAARNGYVDGVNGAGVTIPTQSGKELSITITQLVPTFFMQALGFQPFNVRRTAVAGYKPPISLGQPDAHVGATVATLGAGRGFYFPRVKGFNNERSEGDPYSPNLKESGGPTSTDRHLINTFDATEAPAVDCNGGLSTALPCKGGYNYRIVLPKGSGTNYKIQVYNAAFAPDFGAKHDSCDNHALLPAASCNPQKYTYAEHDFGTYHCDPAASPAIDCTSVKSNYNAMRYTLFSVKNVFLRSDDTVMSQATVLPIDATNYDGAGGANGPGSAAATSGNVSYVNINGNGGKGTAVQQTYDGSGNPTNMNIFHAWMDIANPDGSPAAPLGTGDGGLVQYSNPNYVPGAALADGTYRLRVDSMNYDGKDPAKGGPNGHGSKGYSVRVIDATTGAECAPGLCIVAGWADMCIYTPIKKVPPATDAHGTVPLFELPTEYAGTTIDVDVFDLGDSAPPVYVSLIDPRTNKVFKDSTGNVDIQNLGISRLQNPAQKHAPPQWPNTKPLGPLGAGDRGTFALNEAGAQTADVGWQPDAPAHTETQEFQGSWIRITLQIPADYVAPAPDPVTGQPNDFWSLDYSAGDNANDTFAFTVSARGGPVHLISG